MEWDPHTDTVRMSIDLELPRELFQRLEGEAKLVATAVGKEKEFASAFRFEMAQRGHINHIIRAALQAHLHS